MEARFGWAYVKILLLNPVTRDGTQSLRVGRCQGKVIVGLWPNIEYGYISSLLRGEGFEPLLLDANHAALSYDEMLAQALNFEPALVLLLSITATIEEDRQLARDLLDGLPSAKLAFWGTHATVRPEDYLAPPSGHEDVLSTGGRCFVIRREPDLTALELAKALRDAPGQITEVAGLSFRNNSGGPVLHTADRAFIPDLDALPFPDHEAMGTGTHLATDTGRPFALIKTSRGCPFNCVFCTTHAFHGKRWRARSPESIVEEMRLVAEQRRVNDFFLQSDVFSHDRAWTAELSERLSAAKLGVTWFCNSRVDTLDEDLLVLMKRSGCRLVALGVETGSDRVLRAINKGTTTDRARQTLAACRRVGMPSLTYWVLGLPGETPETIDETLRFINDVHPDYAHVYTPTPLPGSRLFDAYDIGARVERGELAWSDFFQGVSAEFIAPTVDQLEVERGVRRAYLRFYTNPRRLIREALAVRDLSGLQGKVRTFYNMVRNYVLKDE